MKRKVPFRQTPASQANLAEFGRKSKRELCRVGGSNPLSPTNILNSLQTSGLDPLGKARVRQCRKARRYWASRRIMDARPSTKTSTVGRDDSALRPNNQTGSVPICLI